VAVLYIATCVSWAAAISLRNSAFLSGTHFRWGRWSPEKTLYTIAPAIINGEYGVSIREKILEEFNIDKNAVDGKDNDGKRQ
jgi:hypothetical protein